MCKSCSPDISSSESQLTTRLGKAQAPDLSTAQANIQAAGTRAGAYFSSWGSWASEKRKGWGAKTPVSSPPPSAGPDLKRAEDFKREKDRMMGSGTEAIPAVGVEAKRESAFFDAEREGRAGRGDEKR